MTAHAFRRVTEPMGTTDWPRLEKEHWVSRITDNVCQDLRYAWRIVGRNRTFSLSVVLILSFGIAVNTVVFSVINTALLRPLPLPDSDRIVHLVRNVPPGGRNLPRGVTVPAVMIDDLPLWRSASHTMSAFSGYSFPIPGTLLSHGHADRILYARMSPSIFAALRSSPLLGHAFGASEEKPGADTTAILSHSAWQQYFSSRADVVGETIVLNDKTYAIGGVMASNFTFPDGATELWVPLTITPGLHVTMPTLARLNSDTTVDSAEAEATTIFGQLHNFAQRRPSGMAPESGRLVRIISMKERIVAPFRSAMFVLFAAAAAVLAMACANVANLFLIRANRAQFEIAVRASLGATKAQILRQTLLESCILTSLAGAIGYWLAWVVIQPLSKTGLAALPRLAELSVDTRVVVFSVIISLLTGVAFGLAPAFRLSNVQPIQMLRGKGLLGGSQSHVSGHCARHLLLVSQAAVATVLLVTATLLMRSFINLSTLGLGYDPTNVVTFRVALESGRYTDVARRAFIDHVLTSLAETKGVPAAMTTALPLQPGGMSTSSTFPWLGELAHFMLHVVSSDYMQIMRIKIVDGRNFSDSDQANATPVVLINNTMLRTYFPEGAAIGRMIQLNGPAGPGLWQIIGVTDDVRQTALDLDPKPEVFVNLRQWPTTAVAAPALTAVYFVVRDKSDTGQIVATFREVLQHRDPRLPITRIASLNEILATSLSSPKVNATVMSLFAVSAGLLASIGIYAVVAYSVTSQIREIAIRMAIGASGNAVILNFLNTGVSLAFIGIAVGIVGAAGLGDYLDSMLFGLRSTDAFTFVTVAGMLTSVAAIASYVPARRAASVDPVVALRHD